MPRRILSRMSMPKAPLATHIRAAAQAGFDAISITAQAYFHARESEGLSDASIRELLEEHAISVSEIESVQTWLPLGERFTDRNATTTVEEYFTIAQTLRAPVVCAVYFGPSDVPRDTIVERFAQLCDQAAAQQLSIAIEPVPFSPIRDMQIGHSIVAAANRTNGGLVFDTGHHRRAQLDDDTLATIPADRFFRIQVVDGPKQALPDLIDDLRQRCPPGEGEFDIAGLLRHLQSLGVRAPIAVEAYMRHLADKDPFAAASHLARALENVPNRTL